MACRRCREFYEKYPLQEDGCHHLQETPFRILSSPIKCAFDKKGVFSHDNWNCRTLIALRLLAQECEDCYYYRDDLATGTICVIPIPYEIDPPQLGFIVLTYYKERGKTDVAIVIDDSGIEPLRLETAEAVLDWYEKRRDE